MLVQVPKRHITRGEPGHAGRCAVALALTEMGYELVHVGEAIVLIKGCDQHIYVTPVGVKEWMYRFDTDRPVKPFMFILDPPVRTRRLP